MTKLPGPRICVRRLSSFIRASDLIRHSSFGFRNFANGCWHTGSSFRTLMGRFVVAVFALAICASRTNGVISPESGPTTPGSQAALCGGIALAPAQASLTVKRAIWAAINCTRSRIATVAATPPLTTAVTILPERFHMLSAVRA